MVAALKVVVTHLVAAHGNTTNNKSKRSILVALESIVSARGHEEVVALGIFDSLVLSALRSPSDVPASLATFQSFLLPLARKSDVASRSSTVTAEERAAHKSRVDAIWTIAVPFCAAATSPDSKAAFVPTVVKVMGDAKYDLLGVGCKCISGMMSASVAEKVGVKVLASLFNVADKAKGDTVQVNLVCGCIGDVVEAGASVQGVFKKVRKRGVARRSERRRPARGGHEERSGRSAKNMQTFTHFGLQARKAQYSQYTSRV